MYLIIKVFAVEGKTQYLTIYKDVITFTLTEDKNQALAFNSDYSEKFYFAVTAMCQNYERVEIERIRG